ncbi:8-methylmenaquinol:fumarate reductase membrane anchor subunit [subsurface metagenome]
MSKKKFALYLGCTVPVRAQNYELSARLIARHFGIEFVDIPEFTCCGFPIKSVDQRSSLVMAARNLALAEKQGLDMVTLCTACTGTQVEANHELKNDSDKLAEVNKILKKEGLEYKDTVNVHHFARLLYEDVGIDRIKQEVKVDLQNLVNATGARSNPYSERELCCGGAILGIRVDVAYAMAGKKLASIKESGSEAMILICPFCNVMYEQNQKKIEKELEQGFAMPCIYYTQLLGLALGYSPDELGFKINRVKPSKILERIGAVSEKPAG